jgi:hypothetical protein
VHVPRRGPRRKTLLFAAAFLMVAILVIATTSVGAGALKPKNDARDKRNKALGLTNGSNPANDCWKHHQGEGMRDTVIVYPIMPDQLQLNKAQTIQVQIINPWKQELRDISLEVKIMDTVRILAIEGTAANAAAAQDQSFTLDGCLGPISTGQAAADAARTRAGACPINQTLKFDIPAGAVALIANASLYPEPSSPNGLDKNAYEIGWHFQKTTQLSHFGPEPHYDHRYDLARTLIANLTGGGPALI